MKAYTFIFLVLISVLSFSFSTLKKENHKLDFDSIYIGKTGEIDIPGKKIEIFNYIRFYKDGTVITQAVSAYDPEAVSKWFHKEGRFERIGTYKISKNEIIFSVSNDNTPDQLLEGARTDKYLGKILEDAQLELTTEYTSGEYKTATYKAIKLK